MSSLGMGGHQSARMKNDEWLTPPHVLHSLGNFDLDPCSPVERPWNTASKHYTVLDDGLSKDWSGRVWLNPPYGAAASKWLRKLAEHNNGIALVFGRTETKMFFESVWPKASGILFLEGRLYFHYVNGVRAKANSGAPSVLIAYGENNSEILSECDLPGKYVTLNLSAEELVKKGWVKNG